MRTVKQAKSLLARKRAAWSRLSNKYHAETTALIAEIIKNGCDHSETSDYRWEWDSGYGQQHWNTGKVCSYCGWKAPYADGRFTDPKNLKSCS